jgi:hypothetical protein
MQILLSHLSHTRIPFQLREPFGTADAYWRTVHASTDELVRAKELVWKYLHSFPSGEDLATRDGRIARAVLCVLEPSGDDEAISMTAEWFAAMMNDVERR